MGRKYLVLLKWKWEGNNSKEIMNFFPFPIKMGRKWIFSFPILPGKGIPAEPCALVWYGIKRQGWDYVKHVSNHRQRLLFYLRRNDPHKVHCSNVSLASDIFIRINEPFYKIQDSFISGLCFNVLVKYSL